MVLQRGTSLALVASVLAFACEGTTSKATSAAPATAQIRAGHLPPSAKDVIAAAFQSASVPLSVHDSCRNVGTEPTDTTIGRYLAGFAVELKPESGSNGLATSVEETPEGWVCRLMIQRRNGEEVWSWGLEFAFDKSGVLQPGSYRCIGAG